MSKMSELAVQPHQGASYEIAACSKHEPDFNRCRGFVYPRSMPWGDEMMCGYHNLRTLDTLSLIRTIRGEDEPCQRSTIGCSVDHATTDSDCETY